MIIKFPNNFLFGAATSGPQTEGWKNKKSSNVFDYWFKTEPQDFHNGVGPDKVCNTYETYEDDIKLMKEIGMSSYRTSIQWSRLFSDVDNFIVDEDAVKFYRDYFTKIVENGIHLIVNLFHFDIPEIILKKYGGWESRKTIELYEHYARVCFEKFGDIVFEWATFNEPSANTECKYLEGWHYPKVKDFNRFINASHYTMLGHARVTRLFHDMFKDERHKITIILNLTPVYGASDSETNREAAKISELIFNKFFLDPATKGIYPEELISLFKEYGVDFDYTGEDEAILEKGIVDFLGVNYYHPKRVQAPIDKNSKAPHCWFEDYVWPERRINPYRGWEIHPQTIYNIAIDIRDNYNNIPFYIAENGMGVEDEKRFADTNGIIQDDYRIEFIQEHLYWLHKAMNEGANCFGYHNWTFIDCWSWANSFKNRYGFIALDLITGKRTIKKSGHWLKLISESNEVEILPLVVDNLNNYN